MKVLVVGAGGREHAICMALKKSPRVKELYCAPGNAGISQIATCVPIQAADIENMTEYAKKERFDLVFVAPDDPLALGMVDRMQKAGLRAFGPRANAAIIESSKSFSKELMKKYHIPTASYEVFTSKDAALSYLDSHTSFPVVVKADGLALGKGVIIASDRIQAKEAIISMMEEESFGDAGKTVVIEEFLSGSELTILAFSDGKTVKPMISSRDHKRANDGDQGKNTGGMGAVTPGTVLSKGEEEVMYQKIFLPTVQALISEGRPFVGVIYFGLMLTKDGPKVIEYNARFGDPEAQAVLPLLETDFVDILDACLDGRLEEQAIIWRPMASCCVVLASGGYPEAYDTGFPISGLQDCEHLVFHAGTGWRDGEIVTTGGRVLAVYGEGKTPDEAIADAYNGVKKIKFSHMHYRKDIGKTGGGVVI